MTAIRVVVADDQAVVRLGFRMVLDSCPDIEVGEAADGRTAVMMAERLRPDVVLMDVRMPGMDGIEATRRLTTDPAHPVAVLMVTTFELDEYVLGSLAAGASGFLVKDVLPEQLVQAVRDVAAGGAVVAPGATRRLLTRFVQDHRSTTSHPALDLLTGREAEVLRIVARGWSNHQIAVELHLSEATVKTHVSRVLAKLGLHSRAQAVVLAYEAGIARPGRPTSP